MPSFCVACQTPTPKVLRKLTAMPEPTLISTLARFGLIVDTNQQRALGAHLDLIQQYQASISLVSQGDLPALEARHQADSLALAPWVRWAQQLAAEAPGARTLHLDIGSGGGFPAIPLAIALPETDFVLLERSQKKGDFLRLVAATLKLRNVRVLTGEFPRAAAGLSPSSVTARAVEKPERLWPTILAWLPQGCSFLCQFPGDAPALPEGVTLSEPPEALRELSPWQRGEPRVFLRAGTHATPSLPYSSGL